MWDFIIQTDHVIETRRLDLFVVDKKRRTCIIIDFAFPGDSRVEEKEKEKTEKYQDLRRELQKIWNVKVKIIPLVMGSLRAIPKQFGNRLKETWYHSRNRASLEDIFIRNGWNIKAAGCLVILREFPV